MNMPKIQVFVKYNGKIVAEDYGDLIFFDSDTGKFAYWNRLTNEKGRTEHVLVSGRISNPRIVAIMIDGKFVWNDKKME